MDDVLKRFAKILDAAEPKWVVVITPDASLVPEGPDVLDGIPSYATGRGARVWFIKFDSKVAVADQLATMNRLTVSGFPDEICKRAVVSVDSSDVTTSLGDFCEAQAFAQTASDLKNLGPAFEAERQAVEKEWADWELAEGLPDATDPSEATESSVLRTAPSSRHAATCR